MAQAPKQPKKSEEVSNEEEIPSDETIIEISVEEMERVERMAAKIAQAHKDSLTINAAPLTVCNYT